MPALDWTESWVQASGITFVVSFLLFGMSRLVSPMLCEGYSGMKMRHKIDWDSRLASSIHAILTTAMGVWALQSGHMLDVGYSDVPVALRTSPLAVMTLGISLGYLLADFVLVLRYWSALGDPGILSHHFLGVTSLIIALSTTRAHPYVILMLVTEITTPFLNLRVYLNRLGRDSGMLYIVNALTVMFLWVTVRGVMFIWFFLHLRSQQDVLTRELSRLQYVLVALVPGVLFVLNMYWLYKIIKAAMRFANKPSTKVE